MADEGHPDPGPASPELPPGCGDEIIERSEYLGGLIMDDEVRAVFHHGRLHCGVDAGGSCRALSGVGHRVFGNQLLVRDIEST